MLLDDDFGNASSYLLVGHSDDLLFYCQGVLVKRLHLGTRINTVRLYACPVGGVLILVSRSVLATSSSGRMGENPQVSRLRWDARMGVFTSFDATRPSSLCKVRLLTVPLSVQT